MKANKRKILRTLLSCLIVFVVGVVALAVLAYLLIDPLDGGCTRSHRAEADIRTLTTALRTYEMYTKQLPTTGQGLHALVAKPTIEPVPRHWTQILKEMPLDPWGRPYVYRNPGRINPGSFDLYSLGSNGTDNEIGSGE